MNSFLIVAVFAVVYAACAENEQKKGLLDPCSENEEDKVQDKKIKKLDLRGTLRKGFGIIASLQKSDESSVCSPVAALLPLGKLALGAKGSALQELYHTIGMSVESGETDYSDTYHSDYIAVKHHLSSLIAKLRNVSRPFLDVASRLYVSNDRTVYKRFQQQATSIFRSAIQTVDFQHSNTLAAVINGWISSQTHEVISDMVSPDDVSPKSSLVIVNAIYFTGTWVDSFTEPTPGKFYTAKGEREILMMQSKMWYEYSFSDKLNAQLVEIPYAEQNMSMLLVVPKETNGLFDLLKRLKGYPEYLAEAIEEMNRQYIILTMPTFRIESHWNLKTLYQEVGLRSIFKNQNSGLTGIVRDGDVHVSRAIQKAVIDVHDKGKSVHLLSVIPWTTQPIVVSADHPFIFYIRLKSQQLLMGTCC